jgi:hypothetical protein
LRDALARLIRSRPSLNTNAGPALIFGASLRAEHRHCLIVDDFHDASFECNALIQSLLRQEGPQSSHRGNPADQMPDQDCAWRARSMIFRSQICVSRCEDWGPPGAKGIGSARCIRTRRHGSRPQSGNDGVQPRKLAPKIKAGPALVFKLGRERIKRASASRKRLSPSSPLVSSET